MPSVPVLGARDVVRAVPPQAAYDAVREAFVAHARGEWTMPPKLYVTNYPAGDFRAMPALGGGHALLKWVTSFPGNPARGLPTVAGLVLLSDATSGIPGFESHGSCFLDDLRKLGMGVASTTEVTPTDH